VAYSIRPFRATDDAEALAQIIHAAIESIGPYAYNSEQVAAWSARHPDAERFRKRAAKGDLIFVAANARDRPVAYALLEADGHLDHLYCHPDHTRHGLALDLLMEAESRARSRGVSRLYTEASELARATFERAGYTVTHRRDFTIEHDGKAVPIHNYAMEKALF